MSISSAINQALKAARTQLGDLVKAATVRNVTGKTYDSSAGTYTPTTSDRLVEYVPDQFSYNEQMEQGFEQTDLKIGVLNPNNDITITTSDLMILDQVEYRVRKVIPVYVGGFKPLLTVVLRR